MSANTLPGYMYNDLLDSVKTAHPQEADWWRPQTEDEQEAAYAVARADVMLRILLGETITLSNNQIMDSYAWLKIIEEIGPLAREFANLSWPVFSFAYYDYGGSKKQVSPDTFKQMAVALLKNERFSLSAWGNVTPAQREKLATTIAGMDPEEGIAFKHMPKDDVSHRLINSLMYTYKYLHFYEVNRESDRINPKKGLRMPSCFPAYGKEQYKIHIWDSLIKVRDLIKEKHPEMHTVQDTIDALEKYFDREPEQAKYKESRSVLYNALAKVYGVEPGRLSHDTRPKMEEFQKYIDWFYNQKVGRSLLPVPRGIYTMSDDLAETGIYKDIADYFLVTEINHADISQPVIIQHRPITQDEMTMQLSELSWQDILNILDDSDYQDKVLRWRAHFLDSVTTPDERQQQIRNMSRSWNEMQEFVAERLAESIVKKEQDRFIMRVSQKMVSDAGKSTITVIAMVIGTLAGYLADGSKLATLIGGGIGEGVGRILNVFGEAWLNKVLENEQKHRKKTVAGGLQSLLHDRAQINFTSLPGSGYNDK